MSLRARLVATLLAVATAGLLVLAAVTYATQKDFLLDRIDEQTEAALPALGRELADHGARFPGAPLRRGGPFGDRGRGGPGGPGGPAASLPPGTYGELRTIEGETIGTPVVLGYTEADVRRPDLPRELVPGALTTVGSEDGGGVDFRVRASESPGGFGMTVVAIPLDGVSDTLDRLLLVEAIVIAVVLLALGGLSWWLVRLGLLPLARIEQTAGAIAAGDLSHRVDVAGPGTEVGRLGLALNAMLARLERAFAEREASEHRLRQFLSDASHELRTPLASIRGYAELFRMGAASSPEDTGKAMRRIEDEAARMGVLVEDLLTLARLDEVRDAATEEVDVAVLARDAVHDARAVDPERPIDVRAGDGTVVLGDGDQLRQVLANLVRNALVHTPPGTPVEVSAQRLGGEVVLEVRDHGPGLPTDDADALFGRFWRAEGGRERGRAGSGLGLAIVSGIVAAHGGRVAARNAEGGGAAFTVTLPALPAPSQAPLGLL